MKFDYDALVHNLQEQFTQDFTEDQIKELLNLGEEFGKDTPLSTGKRLEINYISFSGKKVTEEQFEYSGKDIAYSQEVNSGLNMWIADNLRGKSSIFKIIKFALTGNNSLKPNISKWLQHILVVFSINDKKYSIKKLESQILQPFFLLNFSAEKAKINALLGEFATESPQAEFLLYLRDMAIDTDGKKKAEFEALLQRLHSLFPNVSRATLEDIVEKIDEPRLSFRFLRAFESLVEPTSDQLTDKIISASLTLQSNRIYYGNYSEDDRNTFIASMLQSGGFHCKDQTRRSTSPSGKSAGEIDILIEDIQHNPIGIIEALNLTYIDTAYIQLHLNKIFTYDANGLKNNYIVVYANAKNFGTFYTSYKTFVSNHTFQYPLVKLEEQDDLPYTDLKKLSTTHIRNGSETTLHHVVINLFKA